MESKEIPIHPKPRDPDSDGFFRKKKKCIYCGEIIEGRSKESWQKAKSNLWVAINLHRKKKGHPKEKRG